MTFVAKKYDEDFMKMFDTDPLIKISARAKRVGHREVAGRAGRGKLLTEPDAAPPNKGRRRSGS